MLLAVVLDGEVAVLVDVEPEVVDEALADVPLVEIFAIEFAWSS